MSAKNKHPSTTTLRKKSKKFDVRFPIDEIETNRSLANIPAYLLKAPESFKAKFYDELKKMSTIDESNVSKAAYQMFIDHFESFIHLLELTPQNVVEILVLGCHYNLQKPIKVCIKFLKDTLSADNILTAMCATTLFEHSDWENCCEIFFNQNTVAILKSNCDLMMTPDVKSVDKRKKFEFFKILHIFRGM